MCQLCGLGFAREKALASHARVHGGDSPNECTYCTEIFWDLSMYHEHLRAKHGVIIGQLEEETDNNFTFPAHERLSEFVCETCGVPFHRQDLLKRHRK